MHLDCLSLPVVYVVGIESVLDAKTFLARARIVDGPGRAAPTYKTVTEAAVVFAQGHAEGFVAD
jgi:hypothetical protein